MNSTKTRQYRIKIKAIHGADTDVNPSFKSKRAFSQSSLWEKIKEGNVSGTIEVQYGGDYKNTFDFTNYEDMRSNLDMCTEPELVREFAQ